MQEITQEQVQSLFDYRNGDLYWKVKPNSRIKIGDKVGTLHKTTKYYLTKINNKQYRIHRLVFLYHHGYLPKYIDHIDGDKLNNNINNLREITSSQNSMNRKSHKNTSSRYKGVCWFKRDQKWVVHITINGKNKHLGLFTNEIEAAITYNKSAIKYYGEYAKLNDI